MNKQLTTIEAAVTAPAVQERLAFAMHLDPNDERSKAKAMACAASVLAEVQKTAGDSKKDLTVCAPDSIAQAMVDAAQFGLQIDGRQHAYLIKYGNRAVFQPGYRAYIFKIKEAYPDANIVVEPIFEGDVFKIIDDGGNQSYTHERKDAFCTDPAKLKGVLVAVQYTDNGRLIKRAVAVPKERIERARRAAKQDFIWKSDYIEKAKAAAVKNACKYMFVALQGLQEMIGYDNKANFETRNYEPASSQRDSVIDNLNASITGEAPKDDAIDADYIEVEEGEDDTMDLLEAGQEAASGGIEVYKAWAATLDEDEIARVKHMGDEWRTIAKSVQTDEGIL